MPIPPLDKKMLLTLDEKGLRTESPYVERDGCTVPFYVPKGWFFAAIPDTSPSPWSAEAALSSGGEWSVCRPAEPSEIGKGPFYEVVRRVMTETRDILVEVRGFPKKSTVARHGDLIRIDRRLLKPPYAPAMPGEGGAFMLCMESVKKRGLGGWALARGTEWPKDDTSRVIDWVEKELGLWKNAWGLLLEAHNASSLLVQSPAWAAAHVTEFLGPLLDRHVLDVVDSSTLAEGDDHGAV